MQKIIEKNEIVLKPWRPDRPTSKGATAYHSAVANAPYHNEILDNLMQLVSRKIKENDVVVDFGAGTGASALRLLKSLNTKIRLWLVDNSPAWLGKAYEIFNNNPDVECFLLEKNDDRYETLAETLGEEVVDHVISANTVHLISNLEQTFRGINGALKPQGTFTFQSGNIKRKDQKNGVLLVDNTIKRVHDIALEIVRSNNKFAKYRENLSKRIDAWCKQRLTIFPKLRSIEDYLSALKQAGFSYEKPLYKLIKIPYEDWMCFLKVKRLQAGILPEIGGKEPSAEEEQDRDTLITMSTNQLFRELEKQNSFADSKCFTLGLTYVRATK